MEEISVKGENYVKASIVAKKFGYTQDYIGQLCRSGQVKATLLGRSWYVNEASLLGHKKGRYRSSLAKSKELVRKVSEERSKQPVYPIGARRPVKYEADEGALWPEIPKKENSDSRDNSEKEAKNIVFSDKEPAPEEPILIKTRAETLPRRPRPPVRTIPAFRPVDRSLDQKPAPRTPAAPRVVRQKRPVLAVMLVAMVLVGELFVIFASLGLEKKLLTTKDGTDMVLYTFDTELAASTLQSLLSRQDRP